MTDTIKVLESLKKSLEGGTSNLNLQQALGGVSQWHIHPNTICHMCRKNPGQTHHKSHRTQWAIFRKMGYWTCGDCVNKKASAFFRKGLTSSRCVHCNVNTYYRHAVTGLGVCETHLGIQTKSVDDIKKIIDKEITKQKSMISSLKKKEKTIAEAAIPYIESGLAEPFALAIAKDDDLIDQVLDLWEQDWWKQYPPDDILICAVLDGELSEEDARWLNDIRSDHERLALSCVKKEIELDWARALLSAGYLKHPEAVPSVLDGGHPVAIARIRKIKVDANLLPPKLGFKISKKTKESNASKINWKTTTLADLDEILTGLSSSQLIKITNGYIPKNSSLDHKSWIREFLTAVDNVDRRSSTVALKRLLDRFKIKGRSTITTKDERLRKLTSMRTTIRTRIQGEVQ